MKKSLWAVFGIFALIFSLVACDNKPKVKEVRIGVDSDSWMNALQTYFDAHQVLEEGFKVKVVNEGAAGSADKISSDHEAMPDIVLAIDGEVPRNFASLGTLNTTTLTKITENGPETYVNGAKVGDQIKYAPVTYDGMAFSWNKNMLEALGISTADANQDGLPDAIDTFEKIFAITKGWHDSGTYPKYKNKEVLTFFPISLGEVWSGYSSLTAEGWQIFESGNALQPGFDDPKFAKGLGFIAAAADNYLSVDKGEAGYSLRLGKDMGWRWDDYLNDEIAPTGLIGTWMNVASAEEKTGSDYRFSKMPTYKQNQLTPFVKTKGFVINGYSKYPAQAKTVFEKLYSQELIQLMVDNSSYLPALKDGAKFNITITSENGKEMAKAFLGNHPEPAYVLPENPAEKAMDAVYYYDGSKLGVVLAKAWDEAKDNTGATRDAWLASLAAEHKAVADAGILAKNKKPE